MDTRESLFYGHKRIDVLRSPTGRRLTRSRSRTLRKFVEQVPPHWEVVLFHHHSRRALERWGLATFMLATTWRGPHGENCSMWMARLTVKGVQYRDACHRRAARRRDRELRAKRSIRTTSRRPRGRPAEPSRSGQ
jgi:hypothetical protein